MFKSALAGWLARRVFDWGGWLGTIFVSLATLYGALPPASQAAIGNVLKGEWQSLTLGALIPLVSLIGSQLFSLRSTIKAQVVTPDGTKVEMKELPKTTQTVVKEQVATAAEKKRPTINPLDALGGLFKRK